MAKLGKFKITSAVINFLSRELSVTMRLPLIEGLAAQQAVGAVTAAIEAGKEVLISASTITRKRTLSQNAYAWVLMYRMAIVLRKTENEVYEDMLRDYGVHEFISIPTEAENLITGSHGAILIDRHERDGVMYSNYECLVGSSKYNTEQMARLIDGIVHECKELGIDTEIE